VSKFEIKAVGWINLTTADGSTLAVQATSIESIEAPPDGSSGSRISVAGRLRHVRETGGDIDGLLRTDRHRRSVLAAARA